MRCHFCFLLLFEKSIHNRLCRKQLARAVGLDNRGYRSGVEKEEAAAAAAAAAAKNILHFKCFLRPIFDVPLSVH